MTLATIAKRPGLAGCQIAERLLLSMSAGAVNAGAFLACQRFVSHVTGTVTLIGLDFGRWPLLGEYMLVLLCFLVGAMTAVFLLAMAPPKQYPARSLYLVAFLVALVAPLGYLGLFGQFGKSVEGPGDFVLLSLLSFAMGLLNATAAGSTTINARFTHLTGHSTDLAINMARAILSCGEERAAALRIAALLAGKIFCFALGAASMVLMVRWGGYTAFLAAAGITLVGTELGQLAHPSPASERRRALGWSSEPSFSQH